MKKMTIYVIHHSHTDVGYTDTQEKMKAHHVGFIREVIELIKKQPRFKWNCESYWCVQQFLAEATAEEKKDFVKFVKSGNIGLSGNYLNLTDLASERVLNETMDACVAELKEYGLSYHYAMTADINGYGWGFADALYNHGVRGLLSCIHTHHGYHPLFRKQVPFRWRTPKGNSLLVWNGEHYLFGNELGIAQASEFEYTLQDGLTFAGLTPYEKACKRIQAFVDTDLAQGYEYDFIPVSVSGNMTDNSPASLKVLEFIDKYNAEHEEIELKLATLDEFFARVEKIENLPEYAGDWTDWWADGVGSTPADTMHYRAASRLYDVARKMDPDGTIGGKENYRSALYNLMFYAEHTWGYSSSITEPYHPQVNNLDQWKRLFALKANESATIACEKIHRHLGETPVSLHRELKFRAANPHDFEVCEMLVQDLEHFYGHEHFDVVDEATGESVPFQISRYSRGPEMCIFVKLAPKQVRTFRLKEKPAPAIRSAGLCARCGIEGIADLSHVLHETPGEYIYTDAIENEYFRIEMSRPCGVTRIYDKKKGKELLREGETAFRPVYEVTPRDLTEDYLWVRRNMGRNRKAVRTRRDFGELIDIKVLENGTLYGRVELKYRLAGTQECSVILTAHKLMPRITVDLRLHKDSVWEPENLYLSLPFAKDGETVCMDKAGAVFRPRIDQLPGTCVDFYAVQNGAAFVGKDGAVILAAQDAPLMTMGSLEAHPIKLMGEGSPNEDELYSWVMNNFWETNFKASLAGFYQFRYTLQTTGTTNPEQIFREAEGINEGIVTFYAFEGEKE